MSKDTPHIVLGVTGSIAAYKAVELVRLMAGKGWNVSVMMTTAATDYIGALTFEALTGNPVVVGRFDQGADGSFKHIDLADVADVIVVAPCTANVMAKVAQGLADDVVTSTLLARDVPLVIAPAMNTRMWNNPATQDNVRLLTSRGIILTEVGHGELACGTTGEGRLCALDVIMKAIEKALGS